MLAPVSPTALPEGEAPFCMILFSGPGPFLSISAGHSVPFLSSVIVTPIRETKAKLPVGGGGFPLFLSVHHLYRTRTQDS